MSTMNFPKRMNESWYVTNKEIGTPKSNQADQSYVVERIVVDGSEQWGALVEISLREWWLEA